MLIEESIWLKNILESYSNEEINPVLNIGSSSLHFRKEKQAFIHSNIFEPLYKRNIKVVHTDLKNQEGVDLVGDLTDGEFVQKLKNDNYKLVICSNLFEHLEYNTRKKISEVLTEIIGKNGYLIVTVPKIFYYHEDPIDTWFRPNIEELMKYFPISEIIKAENVKSNHSFYNELSKNKKILFFTFLKLFIPFYKFKEWKNNIKYFPKWFKKYDTTCILLKYKN